MVTALFWKTGRLFSRYGRERSVSKKLPCLQEHFQVCLMKGSGMKELTYQEAADYVEELPLHTKKNPFELNQRFYEWLGEPGSHSKIVHIAGTNGKGSVCAYLNSVLTGAGYCVGMFTSPHLVDIRERFVLNNEQIPERVFTDLLSKLQSCLADFEGGAYHPTFFETLFFMFMLWMEEEKPDVILLETGMGGRLDVTNVIRHPVLTVITRIGLDHCQYLGETAARIAQEKAGIFKQGVPAVCLETEEEVKNVFVEKAGKLSVPLCLVSKKQVAFSNLKKNCIDFFMESAYYRYIEAHLGTVALYQVENAALTVRALEQIAPVLEVTAQQVEDGLSSMRWKARMEEVLRDFFVDGAHNPDGINAFLESVGQDGWEGQRWLLFGACADKSVAKMIDMTARSGLFDRVTITMIHSARSSDKEALAAMFEAGGVKIDRIFEDAGEAFSFLVRERGERTRIYCAGSLYLAGEIERCVMDRQEVTHD